MLRKIGLKLFFLGALSGVLILAAERAEAENQTCQAVYDNCITRCQSARDILRCENDCWINYLNCQY